MEYGAADFVRTKIDPSFPAFSRQQRRFWTVILLSGSFLLGMTTASTLENGLNRQKCGF